jgi:hypothetical protein
MYGPPAATPRTPALRRRAVEHLGELAGDGTGSRQSEPQPQTRWLRASQRQTCSELLRCAGIAESPLVVAATWRTEVFSVAIRT